MLSSAMQSNFTNTYPLIANETMQQGNSDEDAIVYECVCVSVCAVNTVLYNLQNHIQNLKILAQ